MAQGTPDGWRRLRRNRAAVVSLWFLGAVVLASVIGPYLIVREKKAASDVVFARPWQSVQLSVIDPDDATRHDTAAVDRADRALCVDGDSDAVETVAR